MIVTGDAKTVEWRPIAEYPNYRVSNAGEVQSRYVPGGHGSIGEWYTLKGTWIGQQRYPAVSLCRGEKAKITAIHRIVLEAFVGPCPTGMEACHNNGVLTDNRLSNLRWDTPKSNNQDKIRHGTVGMGERNPMAKLTDAWVIEIVHLLETGNLTQRAIAAQFGISPMAITRIKQGTAWSHVPRNGVE